MGAVCATLQDLDAWIPFGNAVADFTCHRAGSHSIFFVTLSTPVIAWLITRVHPSTRRYWLGWTALVWPTLVTHALLDRVAIYGTQLWFPFSNTPIGWRTICIIDPLYTLRLLLGVLAAALIRRPARLGVRLNALRLIAGTFYLAFTVAAKLHVDAVVAAEVSRQDLPGQGTLSLPTALNALLWRASVTGDSGYYDGFYSLLDDSRNIQFAWYPSRPDLLVPLVQDWPVQRLRWFTRGFIP